MKIIKGSCTDIHVTRKPEPILFHWAGAYFYVSCDILDNEVQVLVNWVKVRDILGRHAETTITVDWTQGTEIPQELGDYLVGRQEYTEQLANRQAMPKLEPSWEFVKRMRSGDYKQPPWDDRQTIVDNLFTACDYIERLQEKEARQPGGGRTGQ